MAIANPLTAAGPASSTMDHAAARGEVRGSRMAAAPSTINLVKSLLNRR
jgi:hypothetical protein